MLRDIIRTLFGGFNARQLAKTYRSRPRQRLCESTHKRTRTRYSSCHWKYIRLPTTYTKVCNSHLFISHTFFFKRELPRVCDPYAPNTHKVPNTADLSHDLSAQSVLLPPPRHSPRFHRTYSALHCVAPGTYDRDTVPVGQVSAYTTFTRQWSDSVRQKPSEVSIWLRGEVGRKVRRSVNSIFIDWLTWTDRRIATG